MSVEFDSVEEIKLALEENLDVLTTYLGALIKAYPPYQRCTAQQVKKVLKDLEDEGIGYYPKKIIAEQNTIIRIYTLNSPAAAVINAVLSPTIESDRPLRSAALFNQALDKFIDAY